MVQAWIPKNESRLDLHQQTGPKLGEHMRNAAGASPANAAVRPERALRSGRQCEGEGDASPGICGVENCTTEEPREPCPAPLAWQDVLRAFRAESRSWRLERDGWRLDGRSWGEGPPVYFLNGLGGTHELFALTVWLLRDRFRCVVFDYREPSAEAAGRRNDYTVDDLADDLLAIADFLGDRRFDVFATSLGAAVALSAMNRQPARIGRAVLQGGFAQIPWSMCERILIGVAGWLPISLRRVPLQARIQQQMHRPWFPPFDVTRWEFFFENTGAVPVSALASRARAVIGQDLRPLLGQVEQPVLILRGEGEGAIAAQRSSELEKLPGAVVEDMHTTGAMPFLTHPHRFAKRIGAFFLDEDELVAAAPAKT